ncbi:MAG: sigma-54 dependent transcriptional regulator [Bacteroidetes bacterium]|nr:sigma-54 dependent transcriptional regulator [Bacteroidota bacterium]
MAEDNVLYEDFAPEENNGATGRNNWKILVVDDNEAVHKATIFALKNYRYKNKGVTLLRAYNNLGAKAHLELNPDIAVVLLDVVMDESGLKLIPFIRDNTVTAKIQIILRTGEPEEAPEREVVEKYEINDYIAKSEATQDKLFTAITSGLRAFENLLKIEEQRRELERMNIVLGERNRNLEHMSKEQQTEIESIKEQLIAKELEKSVGTRFIGVSSKILQVKEKAMNLARFDECVLLAGENGSGKEIIAHLMHHAGPRNHEKFLAFNCTAISESLVESALFGYKKGAFTGAAKDHEGYFKSADNGTLFIDEVAEMDMSVQVKLLRAIEYNEIMPVGANSPEKVNVRILTATNKDLKQQVDDGLFREDLYYRISTSIITVPPLRERPEDIPALTYHFMNSFAEKYSIVPPDMDHNVIKWLQKYRFPGNVRELKNMVYNAIMNCGGKMLGVEDFTMNISGTGSTSEDNTLESAVRKAKRTAIERARELSTSGKAEEICGILCISRANYYRFLKELEIQG